MQKINSTNDTVKIGEINRFFKIAKKKQSEKKWYKKDIKRKNIGKPVEKYSRGCVPLTSFLSYTTLRYIQAVCKRALSFIHKKATAHFDSR